MVPVGGFEGEGDVHGGVFGPMQALIASSVVGLLAGGLRGLLRRDHVTEAVLDQLHEVVVVDADCGHHLSTGGVWKVWRESFEG
jgi:hypothetical protein